MAIGGKIFNVTMVGDQRLIARASGIAGETRQRLKAKIAVLAYRLQALVKQKLSNQVLHVRTGRLRNSIQVRIIDQKNKLLGQVFSSGDVKYAGIHEFGGKTSAHIIEAHKAKALAFQMNGKTVFAKSVQHPGSNIPERSYLRSSLADMRVEIQDELTATVKEAAGTLKAR